MSGYDWSDWYGEEEYVELERRERAREVYYVCMRCGSLVSKSEVDRMPVFMCPRCGFRILLKVRAPPATGRVRRVYAV